MQRNLLADIAGPQSDDDVKAGTCAACGEDLVLEPGRCYHPFYLGGPDGIKCHAQNDYGTIDRSDIYFREDGGYINRRRTLEDYTGHEWKVGDVLDHPFAYWAVPGETLVVDEHGNAAQKGPLSESDRDRHPSEHYWYSIADEMPDYGDVMHNAPHTIVWLPKGDKE